MPRLAQRIGTSLAAQAILVVCVVCAVTLPMITTSGFSSTEGHRAIPAWEMRDTGDYLVPRMFGRAYLRKPPGMAWAIAATSSLLGETEFAARLVSVAASVAMALLVLIVATHWFGKPWGFMSALAMALFPMYWPPGRSAEIEAAHNAATMLAALGALAIMFSRRRWCTPGVAALALGLVLMVTMKGPTGMPALAGVIVAALLAQRSWRPLARADLGLGLAAGLVVVAVLSIMIQRAAHHAEAAAQPIGDFLWYGPFWPRFVDVLLLIPRTFLAGLPLTLLLPVPWFMRSTFDRMFDDDGRTWRLCCALALSWPISMLVFVMLGVDNHRYAMTSMVALAPLAGPAIRVAAQRVRERSSTPYIRWSLMDRPHVWLAGLLIGAAIFIPVYETGRARRSGRDAGLELATHLEDGSVVIANHLIEARPEVLDYARRAAAGEGRRVEVRWLIYEQTIEQMRPGDYIVVRTDDASDERALFEHVHLETIADGRVHEYTFELRRVQ